MAGKKGRPGGNQGGGRRKSDQPRRVSITFTLLPDLVAQLPPRGERSQWVEAAIREKLERGDT